MKAISRPALWLARVVFGVLSIFFAWIVTDTYLHPSQALDAWVYPTAPFVLCVFIILFFGHLLNGIRWLGRTTIVGRVGAIDLFLAFLVVGALVAALMFSISPALIVAVIMALAASMVDGLYKYIWPPSAKMPLRYPRGMIAVEACWIPATGMLLWLSYDPRAWKPQGGLLIAGIFAFSVFTYLICSMTLWKRRCYEAYEDATPLTMIWTRDASGHRVQVAYGNPALLPASPAPPAPAGEHGTAAIQRTGDGSGFIDDADGAAPIF